jgi:hypothetical protein
MPSQDALVLVLVCLNNLHGGCAGLGISDSMGAR